MKIGLVIGFLASLSLLGACSNAPEMTQRKTTTTTTTTYVPPPAPAPIVEQRSTTMTIREEPR